MAKPSILEFESDRPSKKGEHTQRGTKEEIFFVSLFVFQLLHCNSLKICRCERSEAASLVSEGDCFAAYGGSQ